MTTEVPVGVKKAHQLLGGKLFVDPHPYYLEDSMLWLELLAKASYKGIGLYGTLVKMRAIGATLEKNQKFGYLIKPIIKGQNGAKWGWANNEMWEEERKHLIPYAKILTEILKEL